MDESKRQLWVERFDEQANSGMTIDAWCTKQQLSKYTFYYWKQRIRKEKLESMVENTPASMFAKLEISSVRKRQVEPTYPNRINSAKITLSQNWR